MKVVTGTGSPIPAPTVGLQSPADHARLAPGAALLSGFALSARPPISPGVPATNSIALVTVNGRPAEALDAAGNLFAILEIKAGQNRFDVVAIDSFSNRTTNTITVFGTSCPDNFSSLGVVSASLLPEYGRTSFNEWTKVLYADLALRNTGAYPMRAPFYVGITRISDPTVRLLAPDGLSADGIPYYDFTATLNGQTLSPQQSTLNRTLAFSNPNHVQFTYDLVVLGQLNQPPYFTTAPVLEAVVNRPYTYDAEAVDPDGDVLTYSLTRAPVFLTLSPATGLLSGTPGTNALGTHDITLLASDGRGGTAEQHYLLSVINPPSNRPPYFVSTPVTVARVSTNQLSDPQIADLSQWRVVQYPVVAGHYPNSGGQGAAIWVLGVSNNIVTQTRNADPSIFLSDFRLESDEITGTWRASSADTDDDYMGFVFGYQDTNHFYLFDWKRLNQANSDCGDALQGMNLRVLNSSVPLTCSKLWSTFGDGVGMTNLFHNSIGWQADRDYTFNLRFFPGSFTVTIREGTNTLATISLADSTYTNGGFGFYNNSQGQIRYTGFTRTVLGTPAYSYDSEAIDPDGDTLTYSLSNSPAGMKIEPSTGVIRWDPTVAQLGLQNVTIKSDDGRGGSDTQSYQICVLPSDGNPAPVIAPNAPPFITSFPPGPAVVGLPYRYAVRAQDPESQPLTFALGTNVPLGLALNPQPSTRPSSPGHPR